MLRPRRKKLFEKPKILIRQTANRIIAAFDNEKCYGLKSCIIVQVSDHSQIHYFYLLSLLNSSLINFLYQDLVNEEKRVFPEVKPVQLFKLPIKQISPEAQAPVVKLVDEILQLKKQGKDTADEIKRNLLGRQGRLQLVKLGLDNYRSELYLSPNQE